MVSRYDLLLDVESSRLGKLPSSLSAFDGTEAPKIDGFMEASRKPVRRHRGHTNSKWGCSSCKARKVKNKSESTLSCFNASNHCLCQLGCHRLGPQSTRWEVLRLCRYRLTRPGRQCDELKPRCSNCTRRRTACIYHDEDATWNDGLHQFGRSTPPSSETSSNYKTPRLVDSTPSLSLAYSFRHDSPDGFTKGGRHHHSETPTHRPGPDALDINMNHMELFHHFTSTTASAISVGLSTEKLWSKDIPSIALSHRFLMHSILAVSALHLAHLNPGQQSTYYATASAHEDRALHLAQAEMANPTAQNADALFAFVLTTVYYAFAAPAPDSPPSSRSGNVEESDNHRPLSSAIQCINLLRGIRSILPSVKGFVEAGPLSPLLNMELSSIPSSRQFTSPEIEARWSRLLYFASTTAKAGPNEVEDLEIFAAAASSLRASSLKMESLAQVELNTPPMWHWAVRLSSTFVDKLAQSDVVPVVLVAHWCVLLPQVRHHWWIEGWVDRTMREIREVLPEEFRKWLEWPEEILQSVRRAAA